ncbi:MAG TPA: metal-dependent hydrolase [Actinocrinis sp.]|nr:metal-dependent hydrolase [Actinocrinis sp.]
MLVTNHVLSGAVVGALVRNPVLAAPAGIVSHFLLDAAPHWGRWRDDGHFMRVAVADGLTGLAAMGAVTALARPERRAAVVAGMVGAALPDVDKPTHVFFGFSPFPRVINELHKRVQDEAPQRFWTHEVPAALGFAGAFAALAARRRRTRA